MVNGSRPDIMERLKRQHSISFIYRSLPLTHARSEPINADGLKRQLLTARKE